MCGAPLISSSEGNLARVGETAPISEAHWTEPEPASADVHAIEPSVIDIHRADETRESAWVLPEGDLPNFARESETVPYRYRLYIGVAVAVLLAAMVYLGWRGTGGSGDATQSAASRTIPVAPPETPTAAPTTPAPQPSPTKSTSAEHRAPPAAAPAQSQSPAPANSLRDQAANAQSTSHLTPVEAGSPPVASEQSGTEELALAERYLKGNRNTAQDSREAAQWLWRAVAKGNVSATITLSDLYLRGDGVPKSCDQARLLLDAAARKGGGAAAERLRNLQAFGCQ
jgi:type IV secretory pathway VirB10-like protein